MILIALSIGILISLSSIRIYGRKFAKSTLVLIEGLDCSGKKSLAEALVEIQTSTQSVHINIGALVKSPISKLADAFTYNWALSNSIRSHLYALTYIIDGLLYIPKRNSITIQISYYPRHQTYNIVMNKRLLLLMDKLFSKLYITFDYAIYLYADYDERIKRHKKHYESQKEIQSVQSRFMTKKPNLYLLWEQKLKDMISERYQGSCTMVNTTNIPQKEVINTIPVTSFFS